MAIPVMQFPQVQVPESNPLLSGLSTGLQVYSQLLNAFSAPEKMKQARMQSQADLGYKQSQNELLQEQINKLRQPAQYQYGSNMGKSLSDYQHIVETYGEDSPQAAQMKNMMQAGEGNQYHSNVGNMIEDYQKVVQKYGENSPQALTAKQILEGQISSQNAITQSRTAYAQGLPQMLSPAVVREQRIADFMKQGQSLNQAADSAAGKGLMGIPEGNNPQNEMRRGQIESRITKEITPVDVQKRQFASARTEVALQSLDQFVDQGALDYTGTAGKAKLHKDKLIASLTGNVSPKLEAYMNFESQLSAAKNDVASALAVPADQLSRGELGYLFDYNKYSSNPEVAKRQYQNTKNLIKNTEDINFKNMNQVAKMNKELDDKNLKVNKNQENKLQESSPEIKKSLGISESKSQFKMPVFHSKQEFQQWYSQQSNETKEQIKNHLGGR